MALSTRSGGTPPLRAISTAPMHVVELPYAWPQSSFQASRCRLTRSCDYEGTQLEAGRSIRDYLSRRIRMENGYDRFTKLLDGQRWTYGATCRAISRKRCSRWR